MFEFDRTAFKINTFEEADSNILYWRTRPMEERLRALDVLVRRAWGIPADGARKIDRTVAKVRRRGMADLFGKDIQDFFKALNKADVDYILVGGYAVVLHGYNRYTADVDIWVQATEANYRRVIKAFGYFGMPVFDMTLGKFLNTEDYDVFTFGVEPNAIDFMTKVKGLDFDEAYKESSIHEFDDLSIRLVNYHHLIKAKKAAGRGKDLVDVEQLEKVEEE